MVKNDLWIFIHLFKTGGTTINIHFYKHLDWDIDFIHMSPWGNSYRKKNNRLPLEKRSPEERSIVKVISGHEVYYGIHRHIPHKNPKYFTIIREPAKFCISLYNFYYSRKHTDKNFYDWYEQFYNNKYRNCITNFYAKRYTKKTLLPYHDINLQLAKKLLDQCWFIGITENSSIDFKYIFNSMLLPEEYENYRQAGNPQSSLKEIDSHPCNNEEIKKYQHLTEDIRQQIMIDHSIDYDLYHYAKKLNSRKK